MLRLLVESSLRLRGVVIALATLLVAYGVYVTARSKLDVFPEFAPPQVVVHTEAPGLSAEEVEALVTRTVENALAGAGDLESIRSQSIQGLCVVTAIFREGTGILTARQRVSERLVEVSAALPVGIGPPVMAPLTSSTSLILGVGLTSETRSLMEIRTLADWTLKPLLLGVPGVAKVVEFGGEVRQLQVQLSPDRLLAHGVAMTDVIAAARQATGILGAGFVESENQRLPLRTEGQALTPETLGEVVVTARSGGAVRLKDVACVLEAGAPKIGDAAINGKRGVLLLVWGQYGANTLEVTEAVEQALESLKPTLEAEEVELHPSLFRPANFIEASIGNLQASIVAGGLLVAAVLALFLFNLRTAFISLTAIPLSLLTAVIVLDFLGATINTLTLGGLAIAIGEVVDDAIIDVENILRRLRENRLSASPRPVFQVVLDASLEVRSAVVYATFVVALVFIPVLTMTGVQGKLFAPLGLAYILATLASLVVALTVTPALSLVLLRGAPASAEPRYLRGLRVMHRSWLEGLMAHPRLVIGGAVVLCGLAVAAVPFFGGEFLPEFQEGHLIVQMSSAPGTSLEASLRNGCAVTKELLSKSFIQSVSVQVGRAELGEDTMGPDFGELIVALKPLGDEEEAEAARYEIRSALARFPGAKFAVLPFLEERIEETISGTRAEVAVRVYGDDLDLLDRSADEVESLLRGLQGSADVRFQRSEGPQVVVRLRHEELGQLGFRPLEVLESVRTAFQGETVAQIYEKNRVFAVVVILEEALRLDPERIGELRVRNRDRRQVPLREVADVFLATGRHAILHEGARRYQEVSCNVQGRDLASFLLEAKRRIAAGVKLPPGTYVAFAGAAEAQAQARREIALHSALAAAGIVLLLSVVFRRPRNLLLVLANVPFALMGGVLAVFLGGGALSVGSLVGFVTLFGITTRNSIMMISHFEHLVAVEGMPWGLETALRGASERLLPVLMTALVTGLGLLPIAIGTGEAGREIEGPMAMVILGGLVTSTALNLLVLPALALKFGRFAGLAVEDVPDGR